MKKVLLPFLIASSIFASDINLEITNYTLAGNTNIDIPNTNNFQFRGTYLYNDNKNKYNYYSLGIGAIGANALDNYNSKLSLFIDVSHTRNNTAIPVGVGIVNDNFGNIKYPLFAKIEVAYAPAILSFDDANRFFKAKAEIGLKPIQNAKVFVGYKKISFNHNYQSVGYLGVGFIF